MKNSVKKTVTVFALIIGLSTTLIACSGGDAGMGPKSNSSITVLK